MKRYQLVDKRKSYLDGEPAEEWSEMVERSDGPYVLYSEAMAEIGDLRRRLEDANARNRAKAFRGEYDERKLN